MPLISSHSHSYTEWCALYTRLVSVHLRPFFFLRDDSYARFYMYTARRTIHTPIREHRHTHTHTRARRSQSQSAVHQTDRQTDWVCACVCCYWLIFVRRLYSFVFGQLWYITKSLLRL